MKTDTPPALRSAHPAARSTGLAGIGKAFLRALKSQCHPRMLFALLLPFLITLGGAILLIWLFWDPLTGWLTAQVSQWNFIERADQWLLALGLFSLKVWLIPLAAVAILLPVSGILGLAIAAVCVMPIVLGHLERREYAGLARHGRNTLAVGLWNAVWVSVVFGAGWFLTLPLWLVPPMALLLSIFWWAFAFSRMMRVDAVVEHASPTERRILNRRLNTGYWTIGLICALLNLLPPAWVVLPVFSALVYAHYSLDGLARLRQESALQPA